MGFCLFNNIVIGVLHAQKKRAIQRVAILDWDGKTIWCFFVSLRGNMFIVIVFLQSLLVHHGNGTQQAFYDNKDVLFISIHQDGLYPANSGGLDELGEGAGLGTQTNQNTKKNGKTHSKINK